MLRTGQMILMETLKRHTGLNAMTIDMLDDPAVKDKYFALMQMFMDNPPPDEFDVCPFGIQNITLF